MREIVGYEGLYVWDGENVRSYDRIAAGKCGSERVIKGKILKWNYNRDGRPFVGLWKDGKRTVFFKHQLIWMDAHQQAIQVGYEIHHIDGDFTNNSIDNLQLLTREEHKRLHGDKRSQTVNCFKDGKLIAVFLSTHEAARQLGLNQGGISMVANGKAKTYGGYQFSWASEPQSETDGQLLFNFVA